MENKKKYARGHDPNSRKNLKPVKPGEIRNPNGARAHDPVAKAMKKFTNQFLKEIIELAVMGNIDGLRAVVKNPDAPAIQVGVAMSLINAINKGDWPMLESIIVRIVGKVPDKFEFNGLKNISVEFVDP